MDVRPERPEDVLPIHAVTAAAFRDVARSDQSEPDIILRLRAAGALSVSQVATDGDQVVGHVALSPVRINGIAGAWYGLGPVSVLPERQGQGIGQALVRSGLAALRARWAHECVVLGDPDYYARFGFAWDPGLTYGQVPSGYFQRLVFEGPSPTGEVAYHPAFGPHET